MNIFGIIWATVGTLAGIILVAEVLLIIGTWTLNLVDEYKEDHAETTRTIASYKKTKKGGK